MKIVFRGALIALTLALIGCASQTSPSSNTPLTVRVGYFPNLTHAQAVIGIADGTFARALGDSVTLDPKVFNAGPSAIEALFAGQLDLSYIGPNPAINGYVKSNGEALRIIAGATSGGAVLVVRGDAGINVPADLRGKKIATPQLGNTQDVAARAWLMKQGFKLKEQGGDTQVIPVANPDILTLFQKKEIAAAWVPEPWGARLVREANGRIFLDERDLWLDGKFVVAHVIVRTKFLQAHPDVVKRFLAAHVELTQRINADPTTAKQKLNSEIARLTGAALPNEILDDAWSRQTVTYDPIRASLFGSADAAFRLGFLGDTPPNLDNIYDLTLLNAILKERGLAGVE
ncbi:MAG: ABC transporter substrate-binding protein [Anaerolineales bacterium]|nr:ABC transporter substrate-binding protein [Anaerolineales bacterium]